MISGAEDIGAGHDPAVPIHNVALIRQELEGQSANLIELFRGSGVSPNIVENDEALLTYEQVTRIIQNALCLASKPGLGLRIGRRESPTDWGVLGFAMLSCNTVLEMIELVSRFHRTAASMTDVSFDIEGGLAFVELLPPPALNPPVLQFVIEEHFSAFQNALTVVTGKPVPVQSINIAYTKPDYHRLYKEVFRCPVNFDQPRNQYLFSANYLDIPVAQSSELTSKLARKLCETQLKRQSAEPDFLGQVRYYLLLRGSTFADAETVAECMHITSRTLRNRLHVLGTSFQQVLDETRQQLAIQYLKASDLGIDEIAQLVGFSDTSNFRRAFKKWTGRVPSHYRTTQR